MLVRRRFAKDAEGSLALQGLTRAGCKARGRAASENRTTHYFNIDRAEVFPVLSVRSKKAPPRQGVWLTYDDARLGRVKESEPCRTSYRKTDPAAALGTANSTGARPKGSIKGGPRRATGAFKNPVAHRTSMPVPTEIMPDDTTVATCSNGVVGWVP